MSNSTLQLALEIALQTKNLKELDLLMDELKAAGVDVTNLTEESAKLAKQFGELEQKQTLINQFRELKKATGEANAEWQQAQQATANYTAQIANAKDSLEALEASLRQSGSMSQEEAKATQAEYTAMVREIKNLEEAQAEQATKASQLKSQYEDLNTSLVNTRSAMHNVGLSTTGLNEQQRALAEESRLAQQSLAELTAEAEHLNEIAQARILLGIDTDENALAQIEEVTRAYETLRDSGTLTEDELARATQAHTQRVAELESSLAEAQPTLEDIAGEFGNVVAAAGGLAYVATKAMEFETAMSGVKKVVDGTPEQIASLSTEIQNLSVKLGMSSKEVAEIAAQGGQLGVTIDKLGAFTEMAGKMAVAFDMTADKAGDAAAKLANVWGIPVTEVESLGDAINQLGNTTAAKESEIVDVMQRIGGNARQFGLAKEQAAALSSTFISLGQSPEVAATAINGLLTKLSTASVQGDDFKKTLEGMGISANKLADDINNNPQQALSSFLNTLSKMDSQQRSIATFQLFGQDYVDDVNMLVGSLDTYNSALDSVADKSKYAGAMQKEFDAQISTTEEAMNQAKQSFNVVAETVGQTLLPVISTVAGAVGGLTQGIGEFAQSHPLIVSLVTVLAGGQLAMVAMTSAMNIAGMVGLRSGANMVTGFTQGAGATNLATVAVERLTIGYQTLGVVAQRALIGINSAMPTMTAGLNTALGGTATATRTLAGDFRGLAGQMMTLNGLMTAAAGWTIGTGIGESLYKNSETARSFGDELARVVSYMDAIVTDRTFEDVNKNFETSAEQAKRLAEMEKKHAESIEGKAEAILKADEAEKKQKLSQEQTLAVIKEYEEKTKSLNAQMLVMAKSGKENTDEYKKLKEEFISTENKLTALNLAQGKTTKTAQQQADANRQLANSIKLTQAGVEEMTIQLAKMETDGKKGSTAYEELAIKLEKAKLELKAMRAEADNKGIGELLKTDLDKAKESFDALGLEAEQFSHGIDTKTKAALEGFVEVAHLAEGDTRKLALAYNAAKDAAGDNAQAQADLDVKLLQVTAGNQQLAIAVKATADEQSNAKAESLDYGQAMTGVSNSFIEAGNNVRNLAKHMDDFKKAGVDGGNLVVQSLQKMQDEAKTVADYENLIQLWQDMGRQGIVTGDQMAEGLKQAREKTDELKDGINSTEEAFKKMGLTSQAELNKIAKDNKEAYAQIAQDVTVNENLKKQAFEKYAQSVLDANGGIMTAELQTQAVARGYAEVTVENGKISLQTADQIAQANAKVQQSHAGVGQAIDDNTEKLKQQAEAEKQAQAEQAQAQAESTERLFAWIQSVQEAVKQPIRDLEELGVTAEQAEQAFKKLTQQSAVTGERWADFQSWAESMQVLREETERQAESYRKQYEAVTNVTTALGEATANTDTLAQAQQILEYATNANTFALIKLDDQKLENLQKAIDDTDKRLKGLSETAKGVADNLEAELARMDGDDSLARKLEQTRKLEEVQNKLNEARARGNREEIAQYQRAYELQQKINEKENQQAQAKAEEAKRREAETAQKAQAKADNQTATSQTATQATSQHTVVTSPVTTAYPQQTVTNVTANEVVSELIKQAEARAGQAMLKQLISETKRQPF